MILSTTSNSNRDGELKYISTVVECNWEIFKLLNSAYLSKTKSTLENSHCTWKHTRQPWWVSRECHASNLWTLRSSAKKGRQSTDRLISLLQHLYCWPESYTRNKSMWTCVTSRFKGATSRYLQSFKKLRPPCLRINWFQKILVEFCYLILYLGTETVCCRLLLWVACKNGHGLKLERIGPNLPVLMLCPAKM